MSVYTSCASIVHVRNGWKEKEWQLTDGE